jgi:peptidoglycan/LPS O-acetylase OafA/YrhL
LKNTNKLHGIEILRFISALAILVWHYQHFSYPLDNSYYLEEFIRQPFFKFLQVFYRSGNLAVYFFWCISGFIFFWRYGGLIKNLRFKIFFKSRFTRLYPLCLLTLIIVTILQKIHFNYVQEFYIFGFNDLYHFILQLFLASNWGLEDGLSYNIPVWSISTEIITYGIFFIVLKTFRSSVLLNIFIILICLCLKIFYEEEVSSIVDCTLFFFIGGSVSLVSNHLQHIHKIKLKITLSLLACILIYVIIFKNLYTINNFNYLFQLFFYPIIIFLFFDISVESKKLSKFFVFLGNLTFSSYLLHFPIQILIELFYLNVEKEIPTLSNYFFIFYITLVLIISYISFNYFENPVKNYMRKK